MASATNAPNARFSPTKFPNGTSGMAATDSGNGKLKEVVISSGEAQVMEFCAVTLEVARDLLRRDSNVQRVISNFAQNAPTAHVVAASAHQPQDITSVQHSGSVSSSRARRAQLVRA